MIEFRPPIERYSHPTLVCQCISESGDRPCPVHGQPSPHATVERARRLAIALEETCSSGRRELMREYIAELAASAERAERKR